jgi:hypothetical protein
MRPKPGIIYLIAIFSILLSDLAFLWPWAEISFHEAGTGNDVVGLVYYTDAGLKDGDCPRGTALGIAGPIDAWIWFGKVSWVLGNILLLIFTIFLLAKKIKGRFLWATGWLFTTVFFQLLIHPIIECLPLTFPPPLVYQNEWQIGILPTLFASGSLVLAVYCLYSIASRWIFGGETTNKSGNQALL